MPWRGWRIEPITEGDDVKAANSQSAAMAKANSSLKDAVDKATASAANARAVSVVPSLKDGHPVASAPSHLRTRLGDA